MGHVPISQDNANDTSITETVKFYRENFTVHGLSKVFTGNRWEKATWCCILMASLSFVIQQSYHFFIIYQMFDIRTEIRVKTSKDITLPAITLCKRDMGDFICHKNKTVSSNPQVCHVNDEKVLFDKLRIKSSYIIPHPDYSPCIIFNHWGNLTRETEIIFKNEHPGDFNVYVHGSDDIGFSLDRFDKPTTILFWFHLGYKFIFSNKVVSLRLPSPYPSNCSHGQYDDNLFPGPYSERKCINSCIMRHQMSKCGNVIQNWGRYVPDNFKGHNFSEDVTWCLYHSFSFWSVPEHCDCRIDCKDTEIDLKVEPLPS